MVPNANMVVHYHDLIPHIVPQIFGYTHVGTEIWYTDEESKNYKVCIGGEDKTCS